MAGNGNRKGRVGSLLAALVLMVLTGCVARETNGQRVWRECQHITDNAAFTACFAQYMDDAEAQQRAEAKRRSQDSEHTVGTLLQGVAAYYNGRATPQPTPRQTTCQWFGSTMHCTTW